VECQTKWPKDCEQRNCQFCWTPSHFHRLRRPWRTAIPTTTRSVRRAPCHRNPILSTPQPTHSPTTNSEKGDDLKISALRMMMMMMSATAVHQTIVGWDHRRRRGHHIERRRQFLSQRCPCCYHPYLLKSYLKSFMLSYARIFWNKRCKDKIWPLKRYDIFCVSFVLLFCRRLKVG